MAHWPRMLSAFPQLTSQASHATVSVFAPGRLASREYTWVASWGSRRHIDVCHHLRGSCVLVLCVFGTTMRCVLPSFGEGLVESSAQAELRSPAEGFRVRRWDIAYFRTSG